MWKYSLLQSYKDGHPDYDCGVHNKKGKLLLCPSCKSLLAQKQEDKKMFKKLLKDFDDKVKKSGFNDPMDEIGGMSWHAYDSDDYKKAFEELKSEVEKI